MTVRLIVHGRVQNVGYRFFVVKMAEAFDIAGTVRNQSDGSVEVVAMGSEDAVTQFKEQISLGPAHARVDRVDETQLKPRRYTGFTILA